MATWNAMTPEAKDTILRVLRQEAAQFFELVDSDGAWETPTGAGHWQVRDLVGHLVDTGRHPDHVWAQRRRHPHLADRGGLLVCRR